MALNIENIIAEIKEASILELNDLVKAIEEEFGVTAAAPVAAAAAGAADAGRCQRGGAADPGKAAGERKRAWRAAQGLFDDPAGRNGSGRLPDGHDDAPVGRSGERQAESGVHPARYARVLRILRAEDQLGLRLGRRR